GMPRRLLSRLCLSNRGKPGTRRRVHEDAGAAPPQDERIARARQPGRARASRDTSGLPAFRRLPRSERAALDDALVTPGGEGLALTLPRVSEFRIESQNASLSCFLHKAGLSEAGRGKHMADISPELQQELDQLQAAYKA